MLFCWRKWKLSHLPVKENDTVLVSLWGCSKVTTDRGLKHQIAAGRKSRPVAGFGEAYFPDLLIAVTSRMEKREIVSLCSLSCVCGCLFVCLFVLETEFFFAALVVLELIL